MRKDGKIAQTFTEEGLVKVRMKKGRGEPTHTVRDIIALETLIASHAQAKPHTDANPNGTNTNALATNGSQNGALDSNTNNNTNVVSQTAEANGMSITRPVTTNTSNNNVAASSQTIPTNATHNSNGNISSNSNINNLTITPMET